MLYYCFILTMWYVNMNDKIPTQEDLTSFILTMWYVNV